jgi:hypothetical protein
MSAFHALPDASVRSPTYYVARTTALCPECGLATRLLALALPPHHETLDAEGSDGTGDGGGDVSDDWRRSDANAFLFYVEQLPEDVQRRLEQLSSHFRLAQSAATQNIYWANHCEHCGTLLGDHELHCEPDGAFAPSSEAAAASIELLQIIQPLQAAAAGYTLEPEFFRCMRRS